VFPSSATGEYACYLLVSPRLLPTPVTKSQPVVALKLPDIAENLYRVWGSTRKGARWVEIDTESPEADPESIRELAKIVLGLRDARLHAYDRAYLEIGEEIWNSTTPEDTADSGDIEIPTALVAARAARMAYDECAIYFTEVRDSLRNVLIDIEKLIQARELIYSDAFWRKFILKAVATNKAEPQLWDFKETLTIWHAKQDPEKARAKVTLAEDVASLANARGGVLVIGVSDQPREVIGVGDAPRDVENRLMVVRQVIAKHIEYDRDLVLFRQIVPPGKGGEKVCLVIVVAQACEVVGVHDGQGHYTYPVRRETGIERVSSLNLGSQKIHMKSDNHDFMRELNQFVFDN
jgi:hypothetical protein